MFRIRFHGRGGQGMKTASRILGSAAFHAGFIVQDSPVYGAERRGAPMAAFTRIARASIRERGAIVQPDLVVVADDTLLTDTAAQPLLGCDDRCTVLLNSTKKGAEVKHLVAFPGRLLQADFTALALEKTQLLAGVSTALGVASACLVGLSFEDAVAGLAIQQGLAEVPVVNAGGRFLGVVPPLALIEILRREHIEDIHRLAGILRENSHARDAIEEPPVRRARDRLPWLLIGLLGSVLATFIVSRFEHALEARLAVAFFVPEIIYLADAIGTQTEAIAVRGLSLSHTPLRVLLADELAAGLLIGLILGVLTFPAVWFGFGDAQLAVAVALALLGACGIATTIGLFLPWLLFRAGSDPALGSGPVATIIQDVLSLLIYFTIVTIVLR